MRATEPFVQQYVIEHFQTELKTHLWVTTNATRHRYGVNWAIWACRCVCELGTANGQYVSRLIDIARIVCAAGFMKLVCLSVCLSVPSFARRTQLRRVCC